MNHALISSHMLQIRLLGTLQLTVDGQPIKFAALPKTTPLLAYLLLHTKPVLRTTLAFTLWSDVGEEEARGNLRRHLYELRRVLPPEPAGCPWILTEGNTVQWNPQSHYWLDVAHYAECRSDPARLSEAVALYIGDLLFDLSEEWIYFERERLRNLFLDDLAKLVNLHRQQQEYGKAIGYAQQLLRYDLVREDVIRELMSLRYANGDRAGALEEYRRFEQRVRSELDVEPMVETKALYDSIAKNLFRPEPAPSTASPSVSASVDQSIHAPTQSSEVAEPPSNLPAQLTSFFGREEELATLSEWLSSPHNHQRLITLTGAGGSGKSRLAGEALARLRVAHPGRFPHGIFAVWLSDLQQSEQVLPAIATVLNLNISAGQPLLESLENYLRGKQLCLLLDNFEHLQPAAPLIHRLLVAAQKVVVIVTSRAPLQLYGEHEFPLLPLPLPSAAAAPGEPSTLVNSAAVALYVARSRAVNPNFALSPKNRLEVVEICRRLDGLPLAIELAAARSKLLTPQAILTRLTTSLAAQSEFLADRNRTQNERHQTLQATIEWSYRLLTPVEQQLFTHLAAFPSDFTLEQAEAICDLEERGDLFERFEALVNSSLLRQVEGEGEIRFRYLWTIRDFARVRLMQNPKLAEQLDERHARYFLAWATTLMPKLFFAQQRETQAKLEAAHADLHMAMEWSLQQQHAQIGLAFAGALARYWIANSHLLHEGRSFLAKLLALPTAQNATAERAMALISAGILDMHYAYQTFPRQIERYEEAVQIGELLQNSEMIHTARLGLIRPLIYSGAIDRASLLAEQTIAHFRRVQHLWSLGAALWSAALVACHQNDLTRSQRLIEESITLFQSVGDQWWVNFVMVDMAMTYQQRGDLAQARTLFERCLPLAQASGDRISVAAVLGNLADLSLTSEAYDQAEGYAQTALTMFLDLGEQWQPPRLMRRLALLAIRRGDLEQAVTLCHEALAQCRRLNSIHGQSACFVAFATVLAKRQAYAPCTTLLAFAQTLLQTTTVPLLSVDVKVYEQTLGTVRTALSAEAFTAAWTLGETLSWDQALLLVPAT